MAKVFILLGIFVVIVYVYSVKKIKKNKENTKNINTVQEFHDTYHHLMNNRQESPRRNGEENYRRYVTKYNSSEDYREKR